ncbi:hypothetical protein Esti_001738 [Eimeria stiedai]
MEGGPCFTKRLVLLTLQQTLHLLLLIQQLLLPPQVLLPLGVRAAVFAGSSSNNSSSSSSSGLTLPVTPCWIVQRPPRTLNRAADSAPAATTLCVISPVGLPLAEVSEARASSPRGQLRPRNCAAAVAAAAAAAAAAGDDGDAGSSSSDSSSTNSSSSSSGSNSFIASSSSSSSGSGWGTLPRAALEGIRRPLREKPRRRRGTPRLSDSLAGLLATQHAALSGAAAAAAAGRGGAAAGEEGSGFCSSLPALPLPQRGLGRLRVCGGRLARRRLLMPRTDVTRPMMERVRAAVFSMLQSLGVFLLPGLRVLDLFCGSGALAIESVSRGAQHATLVDRSLDCCEARLNPKPQTLYPAAAVNLRHLGCTDSRVLRLCVFELLLAPQRFLTQDTGGTNSSSSNSSSSSMHGCPPFDLVFVCPPYTEVIYGDLLEASSAAAASAAKLLFSGLLKPGSLLVVEFPRELGHLPLQIGFPGAPLQLEGLRNRRYGRTCVALYAVQSSIEKGKQLHSLLPAESNAAGDNEGEAAAAREALHDEPVASAVTYLGAPHEFEPSKQKRRPRT